MAETVTPLRAALLVAALLAAMHGVAHAQEDQDPTRPPAILTAPASPTGNAPAAPAASGVMQVQSILVSLRPGGRRVAVIDGKTLRQGDRFGGGVIETIRATEVVLRKGHQKQILKLYRPVAHGAAT